MEKRKKTLSLYLLVVYFVVVAHQSISHSHNLELDGDAIPNTTHQHEDFINIHHEHHFHVGIFHFLGHLFDSISHASDSADEHLAIIQNTSTTKATDHKAPISEYFNGHNLIWIKVDAESLPDPPYFKISYLQKLTLSTSPLRAPPLHV